MAEASEKSIEERVELHNHALRVKSAKSKLAANKPLTKAEKFALARAKADQARREAEPWLRKMPKGTFIELYGGSSRAFINWREKRGFPWHDNGDEVDAVAACAWFREQLAAGGLSGGADPVGDVAAQRRLEVDTRLAELKLAKAEQEHLRNTGELVPLAELTELIDGLASAIRGGIERLAPYGDEVVQVMVDALDEFEGRRSLGHSE